MPVPESARIFLASKIEQLRRHKPVRIVFPEGGDDRIRHAAARLQAEGLVE